MNKLADASPSKTTGNGADQPAREVLLNVALDLFSRKGYADTSVREIVGGAGVTPPTLYYHFMNKEGLYAYLVSECFRKWQDALVKGTSATGSLAERLVAVTKAHFEFVRHNGPAARFLYGALYGPREQASFVDFATLMKKALEPVRGLLESPSGGLRGHDAEELALSYTGMINMWVQHYFNGANDAISPRRAEQLVELLLSGATAIAGAARKRS
ncbi:MAG TPA: TetR/AcrR family transcriptional regulator [Myxococcota bacterium]|jgi:AcrR family transcriptional regulator|nr:TetR/AcrR family transcriptional regulator [Myxococcota bacterium]